MKLSKDLFARGVRMTHRFGQGLERGDPIMGNETFDIHRPMRVDELSRGGRQSTSQQHGLHNYRPDPSPVIKPNGRAAHTDGPSLDVAMDIAMPVPVGTKRRLGPLRTDK